jgi:hypothetical protein
MADNQMVKIDFEFDLGNVPASAKKFAEYLKGIEGGSKEAQAQLKILGNEIDKTADKMNKSGGSIKKTNQQWTNFALVLQDLPYGFRGIQNNLPALVGGIAGMTGVIYFAASAVIALYTAYDMGLFKSKQATEESKARTEQLKKEKDATNSLYLSTANEAVEVSSLIAVIKSETETRNRKFSALEQLKKINPEIFNGLVLEKNAVIGIDDAYKNYIESLKTIIAVKIKQAELESIIEKRLKAEGVTLSQEEKDIQATGKALNANRIARETDLQQRKENVAQQIKEAKSQVLINGLKKQEADILLQLQSLSSGIKVTTTKDNTGKEKEKAIEAANKAQTKSYLDTLDERAKKEYQALLDLEDSLAKMNAAGYKDASTHFAAYKANMGNIAKEYDDKEYKRNQDSINANIAFETQIYNDSNRAFDAIKKKQADSEASFAKRQTNSIETELTIQEKLNKDSLIRRIDYTKQALAKVAVIAAMSFNPNTIGIYLDAIDKLNAKLKGYGDQWNVTAKSINDSIQNFVISSFTLMGESLGKALAGENVDVFNAFAMLIADALTSIGTSLISYATMVGLAMTLFADPLTWPIALAAGIAAVAAGAFLKTKLSKKQNSGATAFANGGIVSGPTMGLIGEYPGAKSNPEVVAPLDKLKDMLGGNGGGQFVLRGNDLVLALNRSETSLNLRRGA